MASLDDYRRIIRDLLTYVANVPFSNGNMACEAIFDRESDRYIAVTYGWDHEGKPANNAVVHIDIVDGLVWIRCDHTNLVISQELADAGIPKDKIVLGFWPPEMRKRNTEFAVA